VVGKTSHDGQLVIRSILSPRNRRPPNESLVEGDNRQQPAFVLRLGVLLGAGRGHYQDAEALCVRPDIQIALIYVK